MDRTVRFLWTRCNQSRLNTLHFRWILAGIIGLWIGIESGQAGLLSAQQNELPPPPRAQKTLVPQTVSPTDQAPDPSQLIADVVIRGNSVLPEHKLFRVISTRPGRYFDPDLLQQDVDKLWRMPEIRRVNGPFLQNTSNGILVTIEVVERNLIKEVQFIGNRGISKRALKKETDLKEGQPLDVHAIRMAKSRLEDFYKSKGYPRTQVEIMQGDEIEHGKVVFLIHEDQQQRIWQVQFEGNSFASDSRLKTLIKSKPGIGKIVGGLVKRDEIDQDVLRLSSYYKNFGYFNARIGRELVESNDGRWLTLRFIIDEGPRYKVRNVSFIGQQVYEGDQLKKMLSLKPDSDELPDFSAAKMNQDLVSLRELYGGEGFVFAQVDAEPRFLEEPGMLDLVYRIDEGKQYRVGKINVHIEGDVGVTKREVVMNRLSFRSGDLINSNEISNSERRLGGAQIFESGQPGGQGGAPRIVVRTPEMKELDEVRRMADGSEDTGTRYR